MNSCLYSPHFDHIWSISPDHIWSISEEKHHNIESMLNKNE